MFLETQTSQAKKKYISLLRTVGSLSKLFSDSSAPYLYYRIHENVFCKAFDAINHSRADLAIDAAKSEVGLGLKTYLEVNAGGSFQKIAEFNADRKSYTGKPPEEVVRIIAGLRNERVEFATRTYGLSRMIYHCVARRQGEMLISESEMKLIRLDRIGRITATDASIRFTDGQDEYNFNLSKSTLLKRFHPAQKPISIPTPILADPFNALDIEEEAELVPELFEKKLKEKASITLPLYSTRDKTVQEKSGLNQWNAGGRARNKDEVYIPIPSWIHAHFKDFFPPRDVEFELRLPNGKLLKASICQDGGKALMSNPNSELGHWLLRQGLRLEEDQLATYDHLQTVGVDSVEVTKIGEYCYTIDFRPIGSYGEFEIQNKPNS